MGGKVNMSFKAIETQEELDNIIKDRLERARNSVRTEMEEKYKDYEDLKNKASQYDDYKTKSDETISALNSKLSDYEEIKKKNKQFETDSLKVKVCLGKGLPYEMASRLRGSSEEEMEKDADALASVMNLNKQTQPLRNSDTTKPNDDGYRSLLKNLKLED